MPFSILPFLLLIVPVLEIAVFVVVGGQIGVWWTIGLILFTAILGSILLRIQGFQILNSLRQETNAGRIPGKELGHGAMILVAGVLLLTPGFVTDTLGFLLFLPPVRSLLWSFLASKVKFIDPIGMENGDPFSRFRANRSQEDGVVDLDPEDFADLDQEGSQNNKDGSNIKSPWKTIKDK